MKQLLEALDLALEALETLVNGNGFAPRESIEKARTAITAIKQARSAPVQEPDHGDELTIAYMSGLHDGKKKREWVGLTDDDIDQGLLRTPYAMKTAEAWREGVRWAYHQLKEKNGYARKHITDGSPCWCGAEVTYVDPDTGAAVINHKEPQ